MAKNVQSRPDGTSTAPAPRPADLVRNVAVVGHSGAGKTTLVKALLLHAGAISRAGRVDDGTATLDSDDVEQRLHSSVSLGVAQVEHAGVKLTLLDTPGAPDFVGELRAGLRAADWPTAGDDGAQGTIRLVTSWATTEDEVAALLRAL